jgi:hypothetical protein
LAAIKPLERMSVMGLENVEKTVVTLDSTVEQLKDATVKANLAALVNTLIVELDGYSVGGLGAVVDRARQERKRAAAAK